VTIPNGGFGLIPRLNTYIRHDLESREETVIKQIEFYPASVLEYLERWILCNELFNDNVELLHIIEWGDRSVSLVISQPYYFGDVLPVEEIQKVFVSKGWEQIHIDGRSIFYNFAYNVIALDLEPRNCYMGTNGLQPFDVILSRPNEELEKYLGIF